MAAKNQPPYRRHPTKAQFRKAARRRHSLDVSQGDILIEEDARVLRRDGKLVPPVAGAYIDAFIWVSAEHAFHEEDEGDDPTDNQ